MTQDLMKILSTFTCWMMLQSVVFFLIFLTVAMLVHQREELKIIVDGLSLAYLGLMLAGVAFSIIQAGSKV